MPALSPTMTEGRLAAWRKGEGDAVNPGDVLAEIETDKATMEVEAVDEGILGRILVPQGSDGVPVNTVIATILEPGEDASTLAAHPPPVAAASPPDEGESAAGTTPAAEAVPEPAPPQLRGRVLASPLARKRAKEAGIDLAQLRGSGPGGRIVRADIERALAAGGAPPLVSSSDAPPAEAGKPEDVPHSTVRRIVAERLADAWRTIPHIFLTIDCDIDALLDARRKLNDGRAADARLTVNDFVVRAAALALRSVPKLNAWWTESAARRLPKIDVAVAVALDDGLVTPIVRGADRKGLAAISAEVRMLTARGRAGKLMPEEYRGGSMTVSNLGMFGVRQFGAIINPPQAAILAVGAGEPRAVVRDGTLAVSARMTCTLSCDHRLVDGADAARWLAAFRGFVEEPLTMML